MSYERAAEIAGQTAYTSAGGTVIAGLTEVEDISAYDINTLWPE